METVTTTKTVNETRELLGIKEPFDAETAGDIEYETRHHAISFAIPYELTRGMLNWLKIRLITDDKELQEERIQNLKRLISNGVIPQLLKERESGSITCIRAIDRLEWLKENVEREYIELERDYNNQDYKGNNRIINTNIREEEQELYRIEYKQE
ncbi:MAG TPA: hypothetical protein DE060_05935 [Lentisphaeria bacterium]|nr:hypothetical protein [Lentisphaeria bacterium]HCG48735.1 hypothetical protein [Lentisphaeria bacterium]